MGAEAAPTEGRLIYGALADFAVDLFLSTADFVLLAPTGLSAVVRLTIHGLFVTATACAHVAKELCASGHYF